MIRAGFKSLKTNMNTQPNSENPNSLGITGDSKPNVPVFVCLIYVQTREDSTVIGRVANLSGIQDSGSSERDVLGKLVREFKSQVSKMSAEGQEIPWIDPPMSPLENEQVRSVPVHL